MAKNWSESEVEAAVADYFRMLRLELSGDEYNKTEHRRALRELLDNRSHGSVELKHQNISAVLIEMGVPYIEGYKPRFNYQRSLLPGAVARCIAGDPDLRALLEENSRMTPPSPEVDDILAALEKPPAKDEQIAPGVGEPRPNYELPGRFDYLEREARNRSLGAAGERFVIEYERARLIREGKASLADRIEQVSATVGPAAGFDIRSFETNGSDRFIEAKTTKYGKSTPFFVTPNELRFSSRNSSRYRLYRVFRFGETPRMFTLPGRLEDRCRLEPSAFVARPA